MDKFHTYIHTYIYLFSMYMDIHIYTCLILICQSYLLPCQYTLFASE